MEISYILTCEHAGNELPAEYAYLFQGKEEVLFSHQAIDFGALRLAKHLAAAIKLPLYDTATTRLLVEANRSLDNEELFSEYAKKLPKQDKEAILEKYYFPHRNEVEKKIREEMEAGKQVVHLAVHTFTPVLEGQVRDVEIGILFDPQRQAESAFARQLQQQLLNQNAARKVVYNAPYPGTADGFPTYLRKKFSPKQYAGFELEINQKFFLNGKPEVWQQVVEEIKAGLQALTGAFSFPRDPGESRTKQS